MTFAYHTAAGAGRPAVPATARAALLGAALALAAAWFVLRAPVCSKYKLAEAELHARGVWRAPRLGVDTFIVRHVKKGDRWEILLVQRKKEPHKGRWCLPGGFVFWMEDPLDAVKREIEEETQLKVDASAPPAFVTFKGSPTRDPRAHSLSASYVVKVDKESLAGLKSGDDAGAAAWFPLKPAAEGRSPQMAFDHGEILMDCAKWFEKEGKARGLYVDVDE